MKLDAIRQGLRTFDSTFYQAPGRMNIFNEHPFKVLFDYGHNAHAVGMLADLAQRLDVTGRRIVVLAGPGDRRDEDLVAIAKAVAGRFDHYICRRDDNLRNRGPDEVPRIQAQALRAAGVPDALISVIPDEQDAIDAALRMGETGDLVLIFADALVRSWKQITKFKPSGAPAAQPALHSAQAPAFASPSAPPPRSSSPAGGNANGYGTAAAAEVAAAFNLEGLIRDERGIRMAPESDD
jgi:cyanophycin synthetase